MLRKAVYAQVDALEGDHLLVREAGCGVYALLVALSHPRMQVTAYEADPDKYLTAIRCPGVPANLTYIQGRCPEEESR